MTSPASHAAPALCSVPPGSLRRDVFAVAMVALSVATIYACRLTAQPLVGEETRWATAAREMLATGDWIVPRQQGQVFAERPPLTIWLMAILGYLRGDVDPVAVRLPSVAAVVLTSLLVFAYTRVFASRTAAITSALVYATFGQVVMIGRLGESEAAFALFVSASLLMWHWGYARGWRPLIVWSLGFALAALGALVKGPQAPAYFAAITIAFLLLRRDRRYLFSWQTVAGGIVFLAIIAAWQIPFYRATDWPTVCSVWAGLAGDRFHLRGALKHSISYPAETVACLLPWSPILFALARRDVRLRVFPPFPLGGRIMRVVSGKRSIKCRARAFFLLPPLGGEGWGGGMRARAISIGASSPLPNPPHQGEGTKHTSNTIDFRTAACQLLHNPGEGRGKGGSATSPRYSSECNSPISFLITALLVAYPTVWLAAGARGRYFMPLYPLAAVLIGLTIERCATAPYGAAARRAWQQFLIVAAVVIAGCGLVIAAGAALPSGLARILDQPPAFAVLFALAAATAVLVLRNDWRCALAHAFILPVIAITAIVGLGGAGVIINMHVADWNDPTAEVQILVSHLPPGSRLVSFTAIDHRFAYFYPAAIAEIAWPKTVSDLPPGVDYFCFMRHVTDTAESRAAGRGRHAYSTPGVLPFAWEELAAICTDRQANTPTATSVVLGRVLRPVRAELSDATKPQPLKLADGTTWRCISVAAGGSPVATENY